MILNRELREGPPAPPSAVTADIQAPRATVPNSVKGEGPEAQDRQKAVGEYQLNDHRGTLRRTSR